MVFCVKCTALKYFADILTASAQLATVNAGYQDGNCSRSCSFRADHGIMLKRRRRLISISVTTSRIRLNLADIILTPLWLEQIVYEFSFGTCV